MTTSRWYMVALPGQRPAGLVGWASQWPQWGLVRYAALLLLQCVLFIIEGQMVTRLSIKRILDQDYIFHTYRVWIYFRRYDLNFQYTNTDSYYEVYEVSNNIHCAVFQLFIFLIRRIYSDGRHCLQPFKLAECWFDHLSLRWDHLSIIFSHLSPPPYFAYWTKTTIHHGTLKYNMEPLEPTTGNTRDTTLLWHNSFTLSLSLSFWHSLELKVKC